MMMLSSRFFFSSILILLVFSGCFQSSDNQLKTINSFEQVKNQFLKAGKDTLVVVDFDETLGTFSEPYFSSKFRKSSKYAEINKSISQIVSNKSDPEKFRDYITSQMYKLGNFVPVESSLISCIKMLVDRGVKVIVLTQQTTGSKYGGDIKRMEVWRYEKLLEMGIDLSSSFEDQDLVLSNFEKTKKKPVFYKGILCASRQPKGKVLKYFLNKVNYKPKRVLFFDDIKKNARSVSNAMKELNVSCDAYVYTAADKKHEKFHINVLQFQIDFIEKHDEYITVDKARVLMGSEV